MTVDLVDALKDIGLPEGSEGSTPDDAAVTLRIRDAASPSIDQLHRSFIVSRGRNAPSPEGD